MHKRTLVVFKARLEQRGRGILDTSTGAAQSAATVKLDQARLTRSSEYCAAKAMRAKLLQ